MGAEVGRAGDWQLRRYRIGIGFLRQRSGMVQRLSQPAPTDCAVSMVTVYELFCDVEKAQDPASERLLVPNHLRRTRREF
jgi:hypothetical protein